jgi:hypothetical protein
MLFKEIVCMQPQQVQHGGAVALLFQQLQVLRPEATCSSPAVNLLQQLMRYAHLLLLDLGNSHTIQVLLQTQTKQFATDRTGQDRFVE